MRKLLSDICESYRWTVEDDPVVGHIVLGGFVVLAPLWIPLALIGVGVGLFFCWLRKALYA